MANGGDGRRLTPTAARYPTVAPPGEPSLHQNNHPALTVANCESRRLALSLVSRRGHCRKAARQLVGVFIDGLIRATRGSARQFDVQCQLAVEPDGQPDTFH